VTLLLLSVSRQVHSGAAGAHERQADVLTPIPSYASSLIRSSHHTSTSRWPCRTYAVFTYFSLWCFTLTSKNMPMARSMHCLGHYPHLQIANLPSMHDYEKLTYVRALVKELWHWNPVIPLGGAFFAIGTNRDSMCAKLIALWRTTSTTECLLIKGQWSTLIYGE
jgi:hypothetical protein